LYLGSLTTYEEWPESRPTNLAKQWTELTEEETKDVDAWLFKQFNNKNFKLVQTGPGIHVVDRTPLDPIAFTEDKEIKGKATAILKNLSPGRSKRKIQDGCVIRLHGEPQEMEARVVGRHKQSSASIIS